MRAFHANYPLYNILPYFGYFKYDGANGTSPLNRLQSTSLKRDWISYPRFVPGNGHDTLGNLGKRYPLAF
jgi:hypothetical protein